MKTIRMLMLAALFSVNLAEGAHTSARRPNVLLIYTDDHAQWAVGAYGNKEIHTPNIDRLAAEGMRFTRAFTKPVCSPSRAMLLSGRYSHRLGIPDYIPYGNPIHAGNGLPADTPTIASVLKTAGYTTGIVGKWHLGYGERYYPTRFGFDLAEGYRYVASGKEYRIVGQIPFFDVLPTLADVAEIATPAGVDGRSLLPLLKSEPDPPWRDHYCDTYDMIYLGDNGEQPHMRMIRTHDWKLILYYDKEGRALDDGRRHELFDLRATPASLLTFMGNRPRKLPNRSCKHDCMLGSMKPPSAKDDPARNQPVAPRERRWRPRQPPCSK